MLNLLLFFIGITFTFLIARYNKSNKLFWTLLISLMAGFAGGTIAANIGNKEVNVTEISTDNGLQTIDPNPFIKKEIDVYEFKEPVKEINTRNYNMSDVTINSVPSKSGFFKPRQYHDFTDTS